MCTTNVALAVIGSIVFICLLLSVSGGSGGSDCEMIWFHRPGCGYCTQMEGEWASFTSHAPSSIKVRKIDVSKPQHRQMAASYGVQGVPHVVREKNGRRQVFAGPRKSPDFMQFALK
jgi:hypothetical protein